MCLVLEEGRKGWQSGRKAVGILESQRKCVGGVGRIYGFFSPGKDILYIASSYCTCMQDYKRPLASSIWISIISAEIISY